MDVCAVLVLMSCVAWVNGRRPPPFDIKPYCKLKCGKTQSTVCKYKCAVGRKCRKFAALPLEVHERQEILDLHNGLRQRVAQGDDKRGGNNEASNMMILNYDIELEVPAICWGMQCSWGNDSCPVSPKYPKSQGQNVYETVSKSRNESASLRYMSDALHFWYDEIALTEKSRLDKFNSAFDDISRVIVHFTQLVWAKTTHVGCARVFFKRVQYYVYILCNYAPSGNVWGAPVYEFGNATSKCPKGTKRNEHYISLCGELEKISADRLFPFNIGAAGRTAVSKYLLVPMVFVARLAQFLINWKQ